ncbi:MAG: AAA family ATPase [Eggerthellaceae bacterium]
MIDEIQVENLALIREATLVPARGLTVLTGETGAGKTALLSALKLLMGARADKGASATARKPPRVGEVLRRRLFRLCVFRRSCGRSSADAVESGSGRRRSRRAGRHAPRSLGRRSRVSIDGRMASVGELARAIAPTIDLCRSATEHRQLMKTSQHVLYARCLGGRRGGTGAHRLRGRSRRRTRRRELTRVREAAIAPRPARRGALRAAAHRRGGSARGEYDELLDDLARVEHAEALAVAANGAHEALAGEQGAIDALGSAVAALDGAARYDAKLGEFADALRRRATCWRTCARDARLPRGVEFDPETLAQQQERMASLQGLLRTYGPRMEDVLARRAEAADLVSLVDDAAERERAAQRELDLAEEALAQAAPRCRRARRGRPAVRRSRDGADGSPGNGRGAAGVRPRTARARSVDEGGPAGRGVPVPTWPACRRVRSRASHRAARSAASCWP